MRQLWFAVCDDKSHTSPCSRTGCFMFCCRSWRTPPWLYRPSRLVLIYTRHCLVLERRHYCCYLSVFTMHGMPSRTTYLRNRKLRGGGNSAMRDAFSREFTRMKVNVVSEVPAPSLSKGRDSYGDPNLVR